jgi:hypothetical protein
LLGLLIVGAGIVLVSYLADSLYTPLRLFYTGDYHKVVVVKKYQEVHYTRNGPLTGHWMLKINQLDTIYDVQGNIIDEPEVERGDSIYVFCNSKLKTGAYTPEKSITLFRLIMLYPLFPFGNIILSFIFFFPLMVASVQYNKYATVKWFNSIVEQKTSYENKYLYYIFFLNELIPICISIILIFIICFLLIKGVLLMESYNQLARGAAVFVSLLTFCFMPGAIITAASHIKSGTNEVIKTIKGLVKLIGGVFLIKQIGEFALTKDLTKYDNLWSIIIDAIKALFEF